MAGDPMSWQTSYSRVRPLVRAAMLAAILAPALTGPTQAAPGDPGRNATRPVIFAVDPVLGQAYLTSDVGDERSEQSISVMNLASRRTVGSIPYTVPPSAISVNPLTGLVYVANSALDTITVIHGPTLRVVTTARISGGPQVLLLEPTSGRLFVALQRDKAIRVLDVSTLTTLGSIDLGMDTVALGFDRVRNRLLAATMDQETAQASLVAIDNERLVPVTQVSLPDSPDGMAVLDGVGRVYIPLLKGGDLLIVDADQLQIVNRLMGWDTPVRDIAVNERRSRVYLAAGDANLIIALDPLTGSILGSVETGTATDALAIDQATAMIYSATADGSSVDAIMDPVGPQAEPPDLNITFHVTGGLAGLNDVLSISSPGHAHLQRRSGAPIDVELGVNRFQELAALFPESDFFNMLPRHVAPRPIPDALTFSVTARDGQREKNVVMSTAGSPPAPLIDIVRRLERVRQEMISPPVSSSIGFALP